MVQTRPGQLQPRGLSELMPRLWPSTCARSTEKDSSVTFPQYWREERGELPELSAPCRDPCSRHASSHTLPSALLLLPTAEFTAMGAGEGQAERTAGTIPEPPWQQHLSDMPLLEPLRPRVILGPCSWNRGGVTAGPREPLSLWSLRDAASVQPKSPRCPQVFAVPRGAGAGSVWWEAGAWCWAGTGGCHHSQHLSLRGWQGMDGTIAAAATLGGMSWKKYCKDIKDLGNMDF